MIVKKIKIGNTLKTKARQISDLVNYIRCPQGMNSAEKVEHSGGWNFLFDDHAEQRTEMIALAEDATRSKMPVSHYVFSWREYEQPTAEQVDELVDIFLREMGLEGCQTVYGLHYNTENYHVHIAVNRMHPVTMKVIDPNHGFDIEAAHKVLALVEHRQGWASEKNARYAVNEQGEVVRRPKPERIKPRQPALDFECATGEKSAQRIAQERGHAIIQKAQSWPELHEKLAAVGLRFEQKGSGAIIFVGEIAVKASAVDRAFSMGKLCKRLGEFVPGDYPQEKMHLEPEPVSSINLEEWRQYQAATAPSISRVVLEDPSMGLLKDRQRRERETLASKLRQQFLPPLLGTPSNSIRTCPRSILNLTRHLLKLQQRKEIQRLRRKIKRPRPGKQRFEDWLRNCDLGYQADQWRYRHTLETLPSEFHGTPTVIAAPQREPLASYIGHRRAMLKAAPAAKPDRLNAYVALQMRKEGFSREAVADTIFQCTPEDQPGQPERNWRRYAERITAYAFGIAGDMVLARGAAVKEKQPQEQQKHEDEARWEETAVEAPRLRMR